MTASPSGSDLAGGVWTTSGFDAFSRGSMGNAGQNLYVSRAGILQRIHLFDLDLDGWTDLVVCNSHEHSEVPPALLYRTPSATQDGIPIPTLGASSAAAGDLTGDGFADLVIAHEFDGSTVQLNAYVYFGSEVGFTEKYRIELPAPQSTGTAIGDFDGDGRPDIAFASGGKIRWFRQRPIGFEPLRFMDLDIPAAAIASADLDGDGYDDLVVFDGLGGGSILWGGTDGLARDRRSVLPWRVSQGTRHPMDIAAGVVEGPMAPIGPLPSVVRLNAIDHLFLPRDDDVLLVPFGPDRLPGEPIVLPVASALAMTGADLDGDGVVDLAFVCADSAGAGGVVVCWGDPGGWNDQTNVDIPYGVDVASADLDLDGRVEIIVCIQRDANSFSVDSQMLSFVDRTPRLIGRLAGHGARRSVIVESPGGTSVAILGQLAREALGRIPAYVYRGGPSGFSDERRQELEGAGCVTSLCCDVNDDGTPDLILVNASENQPSADPGSSIFLGRDDLTLPDRPDVIIPTKGAMAVAVADLRRSGFLDLVFSRFGAPEIFVFAGSADGFLPPQVIRMHDPDTPALLEGRRLCLVDLDLDGYLDLVVTDAGRDRAYILWGSSDGFDFERRQALSLIRPSSPQAADLTGNGYPDLIVGSHKPSAFGPADSFVYIYWNGPDGIREDRRSQLPAATVLGIAVADFNRDGYLDILATAYHDGRNREIDSRIYWGGADQMYRLDRSKALRTQSAAGVLAADFDQDGWIDIAIVNHKRSGDHVGESFVWWNGPDGFRDDRITRLASRGPHGIMHVGPGNQLDRGSDEFYDSEPYRIPEGCTATEIRWTATCPPRTMVQARLRHASTRERLLESPWLGPDGPDSAYGSGAPVKGVPTGAWLQFQLALRSEGAATPRVSDVSVQFDAQAQ